MSDGVQLLRQMMRSKIIRVVAASGATALLAAGCGGSSPQSGSNTSGPKDIANKAFEFSACMRNHGVTNFPDPKVSSSQPGQTAIAMVVPAQFASSPQFKSASQACRSILPGPGSINRGEISEAASRP